mmetsp:Transcript_7177/g.17227  ORF Transcript_7177/g.17227 Transcript_7177/m.17227 type:complete len:87 (-) Transcript_7177:332-592(-)|eukprot:CAMPEP_0177582432 /NCGR_PEP_ID=MMETSP0419_2-20121207/2739_1 /TAXON_ID=582737 /ORGANISM="Tetraselmis sp., Strain GSL018" /LENGTH=86 /DNA_ID=CAMNT_0019071663 /DNA_START=288 /DNA_END=548 /DNA_ORIENTATION=+
MQGSGAETSPSSGPGKIQEVLPKAGLVVSEKGNLTEVLCKPKIMPLKSITLEKLEEMEKRFADTNAEQATGGEAEMMSFGGAERPE